MNDLKRVKSCVPERVRISCPTCGTRHHLHKITGNYSYVTVSEHTIQHMRHICVSVVLPSSSSDVFDLVFVLALFDEVSLGSCGGSSLTAVFTGSSVSS